MLIRTMELMENDSDSESIYMNMEQAEKNSNQSEIYDNIYLNSRPDIPGSAGACERRKVNVSNMAAVGLGFLCVLLLAVIIVQCIKHNEEMRQIQRGNNNWTTEKDTLQSRYNIMTTERNTLQIRYNILTKKRDTLQRRYSIITRERNTLQNQNNELTSERNQLQSSYNALKSERDAIRKKLTDIDSCPYGWMRFLSNCYRFTYSLKTWEWSRQECLMTGADLVIINSKEEQQFVSGLGKNVWIGLTDREQEGQWKWVDNTPLESGYWMNNEPNNSGLPYADEDCAEIRLQVVPVTANWNDIRCNLSLHGLCEKKIRCSTQ